MGRNCLEDLNHACSKLEAELLELRNIKAEVDYKDLGIDDGAAGRYVLAPLSFDQTCRVQGFALLSWLTTYKVIFIYFAEKKTS